MQLGRGHTKGDTVVWLPRSASCSPATWSSTAPRPTAATPTSTTGRRRSTTLAALEAEALVPGRGAALTERRSRSQTGSTGTRAFVAELYASVAAGRRRRQGPEARSTRTPTPR